MITIHIGLKGIGKTKKLIDSVNNAIKAEKGNVVCIADGTRLMHDIDRGARLIDTDSFKIPNFDTLIGFISGIISRDFDVTHIFIDSVLKIVPAENIVNLDKFITALEFLASKFNVSFTMMISANKEDAPEKVRKYMV